MAEGSREGHDKAAGCAGAPVVSAVCMLASGYSSLALAIAVLEQHVSAEDAFLLSRLEEEFQAESWGRDEEADARTEKLADEILAAGHFLDLLKAG